MMEQEPRKLSWHTLPMVNAERARRMLDRKDDLAQVVLCLERIYSSFVHIVGASQRLETQTGVELDELRGLIAYRLEHAGRWLERLEDILPARSLEFAGASTRKAVSFQGIKGTSHVVVAAKLARAMLANADLVARGESPQPLAELCGDTPPVLQREKILTRVPALASWAREHVAPVPVQDLFRELDIEWANAIRVRNGSRLLQPQVRRAFTDLGLLTTTAAEFLRAVKQLNEDGDDVAGHKSVASKSNLSIHTSRQYLPMLEQAGLLARHPKFKWTLTPAAQDHLTRYESKQKPAH